MVHTRRGHRARRRGAAGASAALLCLAALTGCASARTPAGTTSHNPYRKPLLRCTSAQQSAASGPVHVKNVLGSLTIHVTVGERIDITDNWTPIRPGSTGVGNVSVAVGQHVTCQSGDVQGHFTRGKPGQRLPLIITQAGHTVVAIVDGYEEGNSPISDVVYVDATAGKSAG